MMIFVNAANIRYGGGVQKSVEFIRASASYGAKHRFCYAVSDVVAASLRELLDVGMLDLTVFNVSPARPLGGRRTRKGLLEIEARVRPDVVYSIFGPPYTVFRSPHLMGFAIPWVTHPNAEAWRTLSHPVERARHWAWCQYVTFWTRFADRWVLETGVAADGLARVLGISRERLHVVPNTCAEQYHRARVSGANPDERMAKQHPTEFHLLVFSSWYPHKNLELIPPVAAALARKDPTRRYRFFLTFDTSSAAWASIRRRARELDVEDRVINLGPVKVSDGPGLYASSDALFMPTVLETYTATYPEAMCSRRPIVTTDLPFAREICHEAALYFPPSDALGAADRIVQLAGDEALRNELVRRGDARFAAGRSSRQVFEMFIEIIEITARGRGRSVAGAPRGHEALSPESETTSAR